MEHWKDAALKAAVYVDVRKQLPQDRSPATYRWEGGEAVIDGTERQLLEQLRRKPLFCASRINLSAHVDRLRQRYGAPIVTFHYRNNETGGRFGVYCIGKHITSEH